MVIKSFSSLFFLKYLKPFLFFAAVTGGALLLPACKGESVQLECSIDADCPGSCIDNICKCVTDDHCGAGKMCNTFGNCQVRPPCLGNQDCGDGMICNAADPTGGRCIPDSTCGSSLHCGFNNYCDAGSGACVSGCRNTGDCQLGSICIAGQCQDGACSTCPVQPNPDPTYCPFGSTCTLSGLCEQSALYADLCKRCDTQTRCIDSLFGGKLCANNFSPCTTDSDCGPGACPSGMMCLIDPEGQDLSYCAPNCQTVLDCPNGYETCDSVITVPGTCSSAAECSPGARCIFESESSVGFCECVSNAQCPADSQCIDIARGGGSSIKACENDAKICGKGAGITCDHLAGSAPCATF